MPRQTGFKPNVNEKFPILFLKNACPASSGDANKSSSFWNDHVIFIPELPVETVVVAAKQGCDGVASIWPLSCSLEQIKAACAEMGDGDMVLPGPWTDPEIFYQVAASLKNNATLLLHPNVTPHMIAEIVARMRVDARLCLHPLMKEVKVKVAIAAAYNSGPTLLIHPASTKTILRITGSTMGRKVTYRLDHGTDSDILLGIIAHAGSTHDLSPMISDSYSEAMVKSLQPGSKLMMRVNTTVEMARKVASWLPPKTVLYFELDTAEDVLLAAARSLNSGAYLLLHSQTSEDTKDTIDKLQRVVVALVPGTKLLSTSLAACIKFSRDANTAGRVRLVVVKPEGKEHRTLKRKLLNAGFTALELCGLSESRRLMAEKYHKKLMSSPFCLNAHEVFCLVSQPDAEKKIMALLVNFSSLQKIGATKQDILRFVMQPRGEDFLYYILKSYREYPEYFEGNTYLVDIVYQLKNDFTTVELLFDHLPIVEKYNYSLWVLVDQIRKDNGLEFLNALVQQELQAASPPVPVPQTLGFFRPGPDDDYKRNSQLSNSNPVVPRDDADFCVNNGLSLTDWTDPDDNFPCLSDEFSCFSEDHQLDDYFTLQPWT